ncbi:hypothetical protein ACO2JO_19050 [Leptospira interrogans]
MARLVRKASRAQLALSVASLAEHFDYRPLLDTLVSRYGGQSPSGSITMQGNPKTFTFRCTLPKSKVANFKADWKAGISDLNSKQKERLSPAIAHAFKQLRDQIREDDFLLLMRLLKRKATVAWLLSCAADSGQ